MPVHAPNLDFGWLEHGFGERETVAPANLSTVKQIHSVDVVDADGRQGSFCGEGDALTSGVPGVVVGIKTADCVPVLLADERTRAVAAIHAGWRGTAGEIVTRTIEQMRDRFGTRPEDLHAAIGPAIGVCCYQVSPEVAHRFGAWVPEWLSTTEPVNIDLERVNRIQLERAGVRDVWTAGLCTRCLPERFWSFRREGDRAGRMLSWIGRTL